MGIYSLESCRVGTLKFNFTPQRLNEQTIPLTNVQFLT